MCKRGRRTPEYQAWVNIKRRCLNPNDREFPYYGGRGITVCERWETSFENFYEDMGGRPKECNSIDRIDNNRGYEPGNCRWSTQTEQAGNRRSSIMVTIGGVTRNVSDWSKHFGIAREVVYARIALGWNSEKAITTKILRVHRPKARRAG